MPMYYRRSTTSKFKHFQLISLEFIVVPDLPHLCICLIEIYCRIIGNDIIQKNFEIDKRTGQLTIAKDASLDVNHLNGENLYFSVEVNRFFISIYFHSFPCQQFHGKSNSGNFLWVLICITLYAFNNFII